MAGGSDVKAGGAYVELFTKGFKTTQQQLTAIGSGIAKIGAGVAAMGAAIVGPMTAAVAHFTAAGDALGKMSARTGVAASSLAELQFAAEQGGASIEDIEKGIRKMQRTIVDAEGGTQTSVEALTALGLTAAKLRGMKPEDQFQAIADALNAIPDPTVRAATAMEVFGKSGTQLLPMLSTLREVREEARQRGLVPSDEAVKDAEAINDAFGRIKRTGLAAFFEIGAAVAPVLMPALEMIAKVGTATIHWIQQNQQAVRIIGAVGVALVVVGTVVAALGGGLAAVGLAIGGIGAALPVLAAIAVPLAIAVAVCLVLAAQVAAVVYVMHRLDISIADVIAGVTTLADLFALLAKATVGWLRHLNPLVVVLERGSPILKGLAIAAGAATAAITVQAQSLANAASGWDDYADSIEEATAALDVADQMARGIAAAEEKRQRLRDEFLTADERGQRKEQEIRAAQTQVNNNRVLGFISEEQAQAEQRGLAIALQRHRLAEAERRRREAGGGRVAAPAGAAEPVAAAEKARIEMPSMTATTAAGALALTRGGSGQDPWRPTVEQLRELRRESIRQHEELVRELRDTRPKVSR